MKPDALPDRQDETTLYMHWHGENYNKRQALQAVVANLSPASFADIDIRANLESRLRALEKDEALWYLVASDGWVREFWRFVGYQVRRASAGHVQP